MREHGRRILVVDDDRELQSLMQRLLQSSGYDPLSATTGSDAIDCIRREMPDLIILDLWLEDHFAGWRVMEQMQADERLRQIPVIVMSADTRGVEDGFERIKDWGYVAANKPFDLDDLMATIQAVLPAARSGAV